jgi:hypothetical protein
MQLLPRQVPTKSTDLHLNLETSDRRLAASFSLLRRRLPRDVAFAPGTISALSGRIATYPGTVYLIIEGLEDYV